MNGKWHELDVFLVRRKQRSQLVKTAGVILDDRLADHTPKMIAARLFKAKWKNTTRQKRVNIEKLIDKKTRNSRKRWGKDSKR